MALLAATGAQTETIPPSIVLITIGSVTGVSIAALFTGGILPGVVLAIALAVVARRRMAEDRSQRQRYRRARHRPRLRGGAAGDLLPFVIRTAVIEGVATATEVSTIGIAYSILVGLIVYRDFDLAGAGRCWSARRPCRARSSSSSAAPTAMAWALTQSASRTRWPARWRRRRAEDTDLLIGSIVVFIMLGSVLEGIPAMVLFGPLLFPVAKQLGVHEVHYAMVVILAMGIGLFAPPLGVGYYAACAISKVNPDEGLKYIWGYLAALVLGLLVVAVVPWMSTGFLN